MAWLEKFKGPKYPSTTAPQDATRTNYTPTFQNPTNANVRKINFANSPEQYEINSNTGQTTGRGGLEDATLDAMMALDLPLALGKAAARGIVKNVIPNVYKINPLASKFNPEMFLYRTQPKNFVAGYTEEQYLKDLITDKVLKGEEVPFYLQGKLNQIKYKPEPFRKALDDYHGQWFDKNPERMDFYMKNRLDGDEGNILRLKVPKEEGLSYNLKNFPEAQKASLNYNTEFIVPKNKISESEIFSTNNLQQLIQEDKVFNTPHWLKGYKEVPKQTEGGVVSNLRSQLNLKPKEKATSDHVMQLYENLNLGNFNKEVSDYLTSINDEEELLTHLNKFDEGGIQGRPLISQRPPQFMANQVPLYSTDNNTEVAPEMAPSRLPDPVVEMVEPTIAAPIPTVLPVKSVKPVKQPLLNTTSGTHIATPSAVDKRTLPKTVKPIVNSAHKVETKIESTPVKPLQKSTVTNITKSTSKLPSDALQVLEEKSKNPAWASFKGKYSIYSKENSTLYLFDNNHKLVDQIVAGRGMAKGDFPNTADAHKSAKSNKLKATTPAGSYAIWEERKNSPKSGYGNKTYIYGQPNEAGTATALHDAWGKGNDDEEYARRMAILNDPRIKQKLFSYGCINIPTGWLDKNDANINVGDSVFITPEPMQTNLLGKR